MPYVADIDAPAPVARDAASPPRLVGQDLASRLEVSTRTIRTDIERLRELGYPVEASLVSAVGTASVTATMPPLLLDDEEVVAVAVALRTTAGAGVTGIEEASLRALVKLEQLLPSRLRHRIDAMRAATVSVPGAGPTVDSAVLSAIAGAIRASERLRFDTSTTRQPRPYGPSSRSGLWCGAAAGTCWPGMLIETTGVPSGSTGSRRSTTGPRFRPRTLSDDEATSHVQRSAGSATWRYRARIRIHAPVRSGEGTTAVGGGRVAGRAGPLHHRGRLRYPAPTRPLHRPARHRLRDPRASSTSQAFVRLAERYHRAAQAAIHGLADCTRQRRGAP